MRARIAAAVWVCLVGPFAGADEALTNDDVVRLVGAGLGGAVVVAKIEGSATDFDTSVDALVELTNAGVGDDVIAAMVKSGQATPRPAAATAAVGSGRADDREDGFGRRAAEGDSGQHVPGGAAFGRRGPRDGGGARGTFPDGVPVERPRLQ